MEQRELNQEKIMKGKRTKRTRPPSSSEEEEDMANCLILLAQGSGIIRSTMTKAIKPTAADGIINHDVYRCKTCDKSFSSFQALGGHRTSHKKAKANDDEKKTLSCFKAGDDHDTALSLQISPSENHGGGKSKLHECSICGAEFSSGQALGGHMRRHRVASSGGSGVQMTEESNKKVLGLDLNLPAPEEANFVFGSKEKLLVFSPALVGCHY